MGFPTGVFVRITKSTGKSSDFFGSCEICKKHMSEVFRTRIAREWKRNNGEIYYGHESPVMYAHESCIVQIDKHEVA
jgi:hypothetical protein